MAAQSVDAGLGTPKTRFNGITNIWLGIVLLVVFGIMTAVFALAAYQAPRNRFAEYDASTAMLVIAVVCGVLGVMVFFFTVFRYRGLHVQVYDEGFARIRGRKIEAVRWTDVRSVLQSVTHYRRYGQTISTRYIYTIETADRRRIKLSNEIKDISLLGDTIQQETSKRMLPQAVAAYQSGQPVSFGSITLSKDGVSQGRKQLSWAEVEGVQIENGYVKFKKQGKWFNWANVPAAKIPNLYVFLSMVDNIVGIKRTR
ncbi:MAG: DUF6585 family protein [Anaerolineae bacterium]